MSETDKKREQIIESAIRRFSHFGIQKTTMNEIADDIAVTQPSLYYYFPDKISLIVAVVEKISSDYFNALEERLTTASGLKEAFFIIIDFRRDFLKKFFMMHLTDSSADAIVRVNCAETLQNARLQEIQIVASVIKAALIAGEVSTSDPEKMSALFLDSLTGLTQWVISRAEKSIFPESAQLEMIVKRQRELADVFLRGLSSDDKKTCKV
ncbi:TetR/AcrR family transcriptional regulator [Arcticibacter sp. MXS-1]|uniref:TetR/AcrR family transcriptional regulator n=1 Tax=Arcticibacter sp. MXS-1 TaxID=3341726 RepID=UPI0035A86668